MPAILTTELPHHVEAFERYYALGDRRTYQLLAQETGLDLDSIKLWGRSFDWMRRIEERYAEAARQLADKAFADQVELSERNLRIVRAALARLAKAIADGQVKPRLADLDRLIRLEQHLLGLQAPQKGQLGSTDIGVRIYLPDNGRGGPAEDDEDFPF